jgi:hypothetical protein
MNSVSVTPVSGTRGASESVRVRTGSSSVPANRYRTHVSNQART